MIFGISQLPDETRKWLYLVISSLILSDKWVAEEEKAAFHDAMQWITQEEINELEQKSKDDNQSIPLGRPANLDAKVATILLNEIMRVAAIDGILTLSEMTIIETATRLLGFDEFIAEVALEIAQKLATIQKEVVQLNNIAAEHFSNPTA
ncbi:MAG: hypothetical protein QNL04_05715 [SAR324 cluster bacterium]|nr:hypothetical protein [SAR324 cluster bacterium]